MKRGETTLATLGLRATRISRCCQPQLPRCTFGTKVLARCGRGFVRWRRFVALGVMAAMALGGGDSGGNGGGGVAGGSGGDSAGGGGDADAESGEGGGGGGQVGGDNLRRLPSEERSEERSSGQLAFASVPSERVAVISRT